MNIIKWIKGLILITRQCYKECLAHEKHLEYMVKHCHTSEKHINKFIEEIKKI